MMKDRLAPHGLILRGGFWPDPQEGLGATLLLVGNAGTEMWRAFEPHIDDFSDPLNRWTRKVVEPIAAEFGALPRYPFGEPHWPFQRWAARAEILYPSPLGLLITPIRPLARLARRARLRRSLALPPRSAARARARAAPQTLPKRLPVGAFTAKTTTCPPARPPGKHRRHCPELAATPQCLPPAAWRYPDAQIRFHIALRPDPRRRPPPGTAARPPLTPVIQGGAP